jgi:hypothetical protein
MIFDSTSDTDTPPATESLDTHQKALQINVDPAKYGTFAEIGAGQEVARWFFRVGGAAGTMAKAMSAYDMAFSDAIYGHSGKYVSRDRLEKMLDHEYELLIERLDGKRGAETQFFVYADTCATTSYSRKRDGDGWLAVRFQSSPKSKPSDIIVHCRLRDDVATLQQEAFGVLGVNLVYGAFYLHNNPEQLIISLLDNLSSKRVEIDMIEFSGPDFEGIDNRLMALMLVENGLSEAAMFLATGEVVQPSEILYKKSIIIERGSFRPATKVTVDMLRCATAQFVQEPETQGEHVITVLEMTLHNLTEGEKIDSQDFLDRVDALAGLGFPVLISNFAEYHRLAAYLFRYTTKMIGLVMGVPTLIALFDESYYTDLGGGILESFGRLFKNDLKIYCYPLLEEESGAIISGTNLRVASHLRHLHAYLVENRLIESLRDYDPELLSIFSRKVLQKLQSGDASWENEVPELVAKTIKERKLLGYLSK